MKKVKLDLGKLQLQKEKIINLSQSQMGKIHGGLNTDQNISACAGTHTCQTANANCVPPADPVCGSAAACNTASVCTPGCTGGGGTLVTQKQGECNTYESVCACTF